MSDAPIPPLVTRYPVPDPGEDPRFTIGLTIDAADALVRHGYPRPESASDWVELQLAIWRYIYSLDRP